MAVQVGVSHGFFLQSIWLSRFAWDFSLSAVALDFHSDINEEIRVVVMFFTEILLILRWESMAVQVGVSHVFLKSICFFRFAWDFSLSAVALDFHVFFEFHMCFFRFALDF